MWKRAGHQAGDVRGKEPERMRREEESFWWCNGIRRRTGRQDSLSPELLNFVKTDGRSQREQV